MPSESIEHPRSQQFENQNSKLAEHAARNADDQFQADSKKGNSFVRTNTQRQDGEIQRLGFPAVSMPMPQFRTSERSVASGEVRRLNTEKKGEDRSDTSTKKKEKEEGADKATPKEAEKKLVVDPKREEKNITKLIQQLDSEVFQERTTAQAQLKEIGRAPIKELEAILKVGTAEQRQSARRILECLNSEGALHEQAKSKYPQDRVGAAKEFEKRGDQLTKSRDWDDRDKALKHFNDALNALDFGKTKEEKAKDTSALPLLDKLVRATPFGDKEATKLALQERALAVAKQSKNEKILSSLADRHSDLALSYTLANKYPDAEQHYKEALAITKGKAKGKDTEEVHQALHGVSLSLEYQEKFREALPYRQASVDMSSRLGSPNQRFGLERLGDIHTRLGDHAKAAKTYERALERQEKEQRGPLDDTSIVNKLAYALEKTGNLSGATKLHQKAVEIEKKEPVPTPPGDPQRFGDRNKLTERENKIAMLFEKQGKPVEAEKHFLESLRHRQDKYSGDDISHVKELKALGDFYQRQKQFNKAEKYFRRAEDTYETKGKDLMKEFRTWSKENQDNFLELRKTLIDNQKSLGNKTEAAQLSKQLEQLQKLRKP